jgi:hypothetical protein
VVDDALLRIAAQGAEVPDRQVLDRDVLGGTVEGRVVVVLSVDDRAGCADVGGMVGRLDVGELARAERVDAWCEPVGRVRLVEGEV